VRPIRSHRRTGPRPRLSSERGRSMFTRGRIWKLGGAFRDEGATAVEYAIMLAGVALLIVAVVYAIGPVLADWFNDVRVGLGG